MSPTEIETQRDILHEILSSLDGVKKVYYQPPSKEQIVYPCIIYELTNFVTKHSNNGRYLSFPQYTVQLIDRNPESIIQKELLDLKQGCHVAFDRFFALDNLNHWNYTLVFTRALW